MASYTATVLWERGVDEPFTDNRYGRGHTWSFDGGVSFRASSSPHVVPRFSDPSGVDPEEAFIASLSSCRMLTFLYFAAKRAFDRHKKVTRYALPIWLYVSVTGVVIFFMLRANTALVVR